MEENMWLLEPCGLSSEQAFRTTGREEVKQREAGWLLLYEDLSYGMESIQEHQRATDGFWKKIHDSKKMLPNIKPDTGKTNGRKS